MAEVILKNIKKVYPHQEPAKKKKGSEEKKTNLQITDEGVLAVQEFSLNIADKEFIVLVGPSGCGKSTTLRMVAGLEEISGGELYIDGKLMNDVAPKDRDIAMVFQNYALYPHMTVRENMAFPLKLKKYPKEEIRKRVDQAAEVLGITEYLDRKPKALSGGQRQRVAIAIALILDPDFVVCDEPVSALDVSVQAQVLNLLLDLREQFGLTYLFISHDLNVVSYVSDRIGVMYLGNLVELGKGEAISQMPLHPYTEALFSASMEVEGDRDRIILSGDLPSPAHPPAGCPFHTRCFACEERCKTEKPQLREFEGGRFCACHLVEKRTGKKPVAHNEALEGNV